MSQGEIGESVPLVFIGGPVSLFKLHCIHQKSGCKMCLYQEFIIHCILVSHIQGCKNISVSNTLIFFLLLKNKEKLNITCHLSHVTFRMSPVTCRMSPVTYHLSLTPTAIATDPPPTMHITVVCKYPLYIFFSLSSNTKKSIK